ncbi:MAG: AsmA family protein [Bacteroidales bacterium]|nr:AsmA family protein [Bacteroidales bacterium]
MSAPRILKKIGKILGITLLSIVVLVVLLLVVAKYNENRITHFALREVSKAIQAPVKCDSLSLLLLRRFPYATVEFKGFKLGPTSDTVKYSVRQQYFDTLFSFDRVFVSLKTMPAIKAHFEIKQVEISGINLNYCVDTAGVSNFDFIIPTDTAAKDTAKMMLNVLLQDLTLSNVSLAYKDDRLPAAAHVHIPKLHLEGQIIDDYYAGLVNGSIVLHRCAFSDYRVELMDRTTLDFDLHYDDGRAQVRQLDLSSDGLSLSLDGEAQVDDSIYMDINLNLRQLDIAEVSKYAPEKLLRQFGVGRVGGHATIAAHVKGYFYDTLLLPALQAQVNMQQCHVQLDSLPSLEHLDFVTSIDAPNLYDLGSIKADVSKLDLRSSRSRVKLNGWVRNLLQPSYNLRADLRLSLDEANIFVPKEVVQHVGGTLSTTIDTKGQLPKDIGSPSSIDYFLDHTSLTLNLDRVSAVLDDTMQVHNLSLDFAYTPSRSFSLSNLQAEAPGYGITVGKSLLRGSMLGRMADMDNMGARLDTFFLQAGGANLGGHLTARGLKQPKFDIGAAVNVTFDDMIRSFIPDSLIDYLEGSISLGLRSHGQINLDTIDINKLMPIAFEQSQLKLAVRDLRFGLFEDTLVRVDGLGLDLAMADDTLRLDNLHGAAHGIDFWVDSLEVWNAYRAYMQRRPGAKLIVQTGLRLGDIDYAAFAHLMPATDSTAQSDSTALAPPQAQQPVAVQASPPNSATTPATAQALPAPAAETSISTTSAEAPAFVLPEGMPPFVIRGRMAVNSLRYQKNYIDSISLKFRLDDSLYVVDDFTLRSFGGTMVTSAVCDMRTVDTLNIIEIQNEIKHLDLGRVLRDNDDFGKSELISHKSVGGVLTSKINAQVRLTGFDVNTIQSDKIMVLGTFELADGKLHNFEPIMEVGKMIGRKDLENIDFKTLKTNLFMFKNKAFIPKTDIVTSALDLTAYGMQSFVWPQGMGEEYEYHAVIHLGDVLFGKSKKLKNKQKDADVERKGMSVVAMNNEGVKRTFLDNKDLQRKMRMTLRLQHSVLATLFHPKLVNFSTELDRMKHKKTATVVDLTEE